MAIRQRELVHCLHIRGSEDQGEYLMPDKVQALLSNCANHLKPIVTLAACPSASISPFRP